MTCKLCEVQSRPPGGVKCQCAFRAIDCVTGDLCFDPDNHNCATLNALRHQAETYGRTITTWRCGRLWVLPHPHRGGWIILAASEDRRQIDNAVYIEGNGVCPLLLPLAEEVIEYYRALSRSRDCEVLEE